MTKPKQSIIITIINSLLSALHLYFELIVQKCVHVSSILSYKCLLTSRGCCPPALPGGVVLSEPASYHYTQNNYVFNHITTRILTSQNNPRVPSTPRSSSLPPLDSVRPGSEACASVLSVTHRNTGQTKTMILLWIYVDRLETAELSVSHKNKSWAEFIRA